MYVYACSEPLAREQRGRVTPSPLGVGRDDYGDLRGGGGCTPRWWAVGGHYAQVLLAAIDQVPRVGLRDVRTLGIVRDHRDTRLD